MGSLAKSSSLQTGKMMKSIAVVALCLFAAAAGAPEAEASADASAYYGLHGYYGHGYGHGYYGHGHALGYYGHALGYGHGYGHGYHYGKRSADAEPAADAY